MGRLSWRIPEYLLLKRVVASAEFAALSANPKGWWASATRMLTDNYLADLSTPFVAESDGDFKMRQGLQHRAEHLVPYPAETEAEHRLRMATIAKVSPF